MTDRLRRDISTSALLVASAGGMIGSGWLFSPLYAAQIAGPNALVAWALAAIFMIFIALPLCELGTLLPVSGGMSNYPKLTHGPAIGFIFSWVAWLSYVVMTPIEVQAVLQYASIFFPILTHKSTTGAFELTGIGYTTAFVLMIILVIANTFGIKLLAQANKYISIWKFVIPMMAVVAFLMCSKSLNNLNGFHLDSPSSWHDIFSALAIGGVAFGFTGFQNGLILAGEVKKPQKSIPISLIGAVVVGFIFYFLLQFSFIAAIPHEFLKGGFSALSFSGESGPLVGLGMILGLGIVVKLLLIDSMVSPLATGLVYTTATSRILYGMAENGFLPKKLLDLNKNKIPYVTLFINFIFGMMAFLPLPGWQKMVSFLSSTSILSYGIGSICLLAMRKQRPDVERPFYLPFHNFISYVAFFVCNLMLYWCGFDIMWKLYVAVVVGFVIFVFSQKEKVSSVLNLNSLWFVVYFHLILAVSALGTFNGSQILQAPYDSILIALISVVSLAWSRASATMPVVVESQIDEKEVAAQVVVS